MKEKRGSRNHMRMGATEKEKGMFDTKFCVLNTIHYILRGFSIKLQICSFVIEYASELQDMVFDVLGVTTGQAAAGRRRGGE